MINALPTLYKRDTKGKLRSWIVEYEGAGIRTVAGLEDGKKVTSEWKICSAKNVGRANATTDEEQAIAEAQALWDKRIEKESHRQTAIMNLKRIQRLYQISIQ